MLSHFRAQTGARRGAGPGGGGGGGGCVREEPATLAFLALALMIMFPPGFMAGSSFAQPIVICSGQGPVTMMMMEHGGHHQSDKAPHQRNDHPCPFAGHGATPLTPDVSTANHAGGLLAASIAIVSVPAIAPGRGMAAPPPPSHAPPSTPRLIDSASRLAGCLFDARASARRSVRSSAMPISITARLAVAKCRHRAVEDLI